MILRTLLALVLGATLASGQLQIFVVDGESERAVSALIDVGAVPAGDDLDTRFRVRNSGSATIPVQTITASGSGFRISSGPSLPASLAPGGSTQFTVRFSPPAFGSYSAILQVNTLSLLLRGSAAAEPSVMIEQDGVRLVLKSGAVVDFGSVERESSASRRFRIVNETFAPLQVSAISVDGDFHVEVAAPLALAPGDALEFDLEFRPRAAATLEGTLRIAGRTFRLRGLGLDFPFPPLRINIDPAAFMSGRQARISLEFDSAPRSRSVGELRVEFQPAVDLAPEDPAILFVDSGARSIAFESTTDDSKVQFEGVAETVLQTGTTAGTMVLTARIGSVTEELSIAIPAAAVGLDSARAVRTAAGVDVHLTGFDNTRSASQLAFFFFDSAGSAVGAGPIRVDAAGDYRRYFATAATGGAFQLRASFPIAGNAALVTAVEVEITNSAGVARSDRIRF